MEALGTASNGVQTHSAETQKRALLNELLARQLASESFADFNRYIAPDQPPAQHHLLLCNALDKVLAGEIKRLMVLMPPGSAKSTYATVRFPAYFLGKMGERGIITASFDEELATDFGRKVRNLVASPKYQNVFPHVTLAPDSRAKGEWATTEGGFYFATGVGGSINGRRAGLGLIDDPLKGRRAADQEIVRKTTWGWYINDFRSRLWPDSPIVLINTRWHTDDPAGRILPESWSGESGWIEARDGERWYVICLPAEAREDDVLGRAPGEWLWTEWFNEAYWEQTKKTAMLNDVRDWNALYQQVPADLQGTYFQRAWFDNRYDVLPKHLNSYMSGDFAVTEGSGDFTELAAWGVDASEQIYVKDWYTGQVTSDVWTDELIEMSDLHNALVFIGEGGPIRRTVEPWLTKRMRELGKFVRCEWLVAPSKESDSINGKAVAARTFQALARMGRIRFPRTVWAERVIDQLCMFPGNVGHKDDCVDTCSLFARYIASTWAAIEPEKPKQPEWDAPLVIKDFLPREASSEW